MDGPYPTGYIVPFVSGRRALDEKPGELRGPVALYAEVVRYGRRLPLPLHLIFGQRCETLWRSEDVPVPADVGSPEWRAISDRLMSEALAVAADYEKGRC